MNGYLNIVHDARVRMGLELNLALLRSREQGLCDVYVCFELLSTWILLIVPTPYEIVFEYCFAYYQGKSIMRLHRSPILNHCSYTRPPELSGNIYEKYERVLVVNWLINMYYISTVFMVTRCPSAKRKCKLSSISCVLNY